MKKVSLVKFVVMYSLAIDFLIGDKPSRRNTELIKFCWEDYNYGVERGDIQSKDDYSLSASIELYDRLKSEGLLGIDKYVMHDNLY